MELKINKDYELLSISAARIIANEIRKNPRTVLGLATGSTPLGTYKELIRMHVEEGLDFSQVITFNLDEYYGLSPKNKQSYYYFMYENFFKYINIKNENIHIPAGQVKNINSYCKKYDNEIKRCGGIDIQLLGIGQNGHIGFNEPDNELCLPTHLTKLSNDTIEANSRFFDSFDKVPKLAITMGLENILKSKKILLLANGKIKAQIVDKLLKQTSVSTQIPASILLLHNNVVIIIDEHAASIYKNNKQS